MNQNLMRKKMRINPFRRNQVKPEHLKQDNGTDNTGVRFITQQDVNEKLAGTTINTGNAYNYSILLSPVLWIAENLSSIPINIYDKDAEKGDGGSDVPVDSEIADRMLALINDDLLFDLGAAFSLFGNAYILIERDNAREPTRLQHLDPTWVTVKGSNITKEPALYEVQYPGTEGVPGNRSTGNKEEYPVEDIIHIKRGTDPVNPLLGLSPLDALIREATNDVEAADVSSSVIKNRGIMTFISPKDRTQVMDDKMIKAMQKQIDESYTGKNRGKAHIANWPMVVDQMQVDMNKFALQDVRGFSEERVCAIFRIPAAVLGFGVGLRQIKVGATLQAQLSIAWENAILPVVDNILDRLNVKIAEKEFSDTLVYGYQLPEGHVALANANTLAERDERNAKKADMLYKAGLITLNEAREAVGYEPVTDGDDLPNNTTDNEEPGGREEDAGTNRERDGSTENI